MSIENVPLFCRRRRLRAIYAVHVVYAKNKSTQVRNSSVSLWMSKQKSNRTKATKWANCFVGNNANRSARSQEELNQNWHSWNVFIYLLVDFVFNSRNLKHRNTNRHSTCTNKQTTAESSVDCVCLETIDSQFGHVMSISTQTISTTKFW